MTQATRTGPIKQSSAAKAKRRSEKVAADAGALGHVLQPTEVPQHKWRTDLVPPILSFVVYGVPAPQGSKEFKGFRNGKPVLKEQSDALSPWRKAVREMARQAILDWSSRTGNTWAALDEPVMVSAVVTVPATAAATKRGDVYATGTPDLDKLERGIGDALAPSPLKPGEGEGYGAAAKEKIRSGLMEQRRKQAVLHDDSRIVVWDHCVKVYPKTTPDSLGYSGVAIRIWRMSDVEAAATTPTITRDDTQLMTTGDMRQWVRPATGETWPEITQRLLGEPQDTPNTTDPIRITRRTINDHGARRLLAALFAHGVDHPVAVTIE